MLKSFAQGLCKPTNPFSMLSLNPVPMFFKSKIKRSRAERIQRYLANPKFKKVVKMKVPDFKNPDMTFPINVPLRTTFVFRVSKTKPRLPEHDLINFKAMTGNEILLNLSNADHLRPSELSGALLELSKREESAKIDWNEHEWIKRCVEICNAKLPQYGARTVTTLLWAFHKLRITEPLLWTSLERASSKIVHKLKGKGLGVTFIAFNSGPDRCSREYKERLASLLPIYINNLNPDLFTRCFELAIKENLMTEYLFHENFFMVIWKRALFLGPKAYPQIIDGLLEYGYKSDLEFWNKDFIPVIEKTLDKMTGSQAQAILEKLQLAKKNIPKLQISYLEELLKERIDFANTTLKRVENAKFWNIVKNDIEYYRQKEKLRMEKERERKQA